MLTLQNRLAFAVALGVTALVVSCVELPDTELRNRGGKAGQSALAGKSGSAAAGAGVGGNGGTPAGTAGLGVGGTATAGAGAGSGGDVSSGASGGTAGVNGSGVGGSAGGGGAKGSAGRGSGAGGSSTTGDAGANEAGAMPGGSGGAGGSSTNPDDFFGASRCAASSFALCEDFESGSLDTDTWTPRGAAPKIETVRAARGTHSAHFHTSDNGLQYISQTKTFPAPNNRYYARVFVWFDAMPTAPDWAHWTIPGATHDDGSGDETPEIRIGGQWDTNRQADYFGVGTDHGDTGDWTNLDTDPSGSAQTVPVKSWVCLEWMFDGSANETRFWWDNVEHPSLATSSTNHGGTSDPFLLPDFNAMWVGWWLYQPGTAPPAFDIWIDEVAVDYERIGCER